MNQTVWKQAKRLLCGLLAFALLAGCLPGLSVFAAEGDMPAPTQPPAAAETLETDPTAAPEASAALQNAQQAPADSSEGFPSEDDPDRPQPAPQPGAEPTAAPDAPASPAGENGPAAPEASAEPETTQPEATAEPEAPADLETPATPEAFLAAVDALSALSAQDDPDPAALLAAQQQVIALYKALSEEDKAALGAEYAAMVAALEEIMTLEEPEPEEKALPGTVYVSENAPVDDTAPQGSEKNPFSSLAKAVDAINEAPESERAFTIVLLSDLTATRCARINSKNITIKGNGHTITRAESFRQIQDVARSTYNPAMIEVCDPTHSLHASLRLEDITLDDAERTAGTRYAQASTDTKGGNDDTVQDGIIATYDGVGNITLGPGATLKGYGGMSAVRLSGGTLVMESGSMITGGKNFGTKGGGTGPAGAIWIQGGSFTMNEGAKTTGVTGRAVYIDGGSATINGEISHITCNEYMWQGGYSGVAIHIRNKGYAVLGETGVIDTITGKHASYRGAVMTNGSRGEGLWDFEAKPGSVIRNVKDFPTLYSNYGTELLNGLITDCSNDFIIGGFAQKTTIGECGVIENCTATRGAAKAIVYTSNASQIFLRGKVQNNTVSYAFYIINQSGGGASLEMYDGALIKGNSGTGVYINASECKFTMHGGVITENKSYGVYAREKAGRAATFEMKGGSITNNGSYGVYYSTNSGKTGYVDISNGEISGNGSDYSPYQISIAGFYAEDALSRVHIDENVVKAGNGKGVMVSTSFAPLTLDPNYAAVELGNAKTAAASRIETLVKEYDKDSAEAVSPYTVAGSSALWFKPTEATLHFAANRPSSSTVNPNNYLKVGYIPLKADGTPMDGATLTVVNVENTEQVDVTLTGLTPNQPYALRWVVPNEAVTGSLQLTTKEKSVQEVEGQTEPYQIKYTATYSFKNLYSSVAEGDTFKIAITLDENLTYKDNSAKLSSSRSYFEQVGEAVYDPDSHTVTVELKVIKKIYSFTSVDIDLETTFDPELFERPLSDAWKQELSTNAGVSGTLQSGKEIEHTTQIPCVTHLTPLARYTVTFNSNGGSAVASQRILGGKTAAAPAAPTRAGYTFAGWTLNGAAFSFDNPINADITLVAQWNAIPTPISPVTPTPTPAPLVAVPVAPAPAAPAAPAAPPEELEEPEPPLAGPEATPAPSATPEPEQLEEPEAPLVGPDDSAWALINLLLALITLLGGALTLLGLFGKRGSMRLASILPALGAPITFLLTENLRSPMAFTDRWTLLMAVIALVQLALSVLAHKQSEKEEEEGEHNA